MTAMPIACSRSRPDGTVIDGDFLLAICAKDLKERGLLDNNLVVSTVMANLGFQLAMKREGIDVITTKVGDRYVLEAMREHGAVLAVSSPATSFSASATRRAMVSCPRLSYWASSLQVARRPRSS